MTTPLEDRMAAVLSDLRANVFNARFTDRYGHGRAIDETLNEYNEKQKEANK